MQYGAVRYAGDAEAREDRQTDSFSWDMNPHPPRLCGQEEKRAEAAAVGEEAGQVWRGGNVNYHRGPSLELCSSEGLIRSYGLHPPRPQRPRVLHPPPLIYQRPGYSYLPPTLSPSSSLGRKVRITHARKLAQHPWYVPGAYVNSEAASPAISGPAALVASSGSRSIPHVWLSRCRAGPVLTAATDSSRARASETRTRTLAR